MSTKPPNIFLSWSGPRSKHVAKALNEWLPTVLQSARPWFSTLSIDKGSRPIEEITKALDSIVVAISCLTPENLTSSWLVFEAGALSKPIGAKSRLCTYLLDGLSPEGVPPPLGMFQHTRADKDETKLMLRSINTAITDDPVPEGALDKLFERMWPDLQKDINSMPPLQDIMPAERSIGEMVGEVLNILRSEVRTKSVLADLGAALGNNQSLLQRIYSPMPHPLRGAPPLEPVVITDGWGAFPAFNCPRCGSNLIGALGDKLECMYCRARNFGDSSIVKFAV